MDCLWLQIRAPFAAFRGFQAGVYRATAPIMPPSAALGLVLNLAGIEMRETTMGVTTLIRADVPCIKLAIGTVAGAESEICTLYQQLHSYPVGNSGKDDLKPRTKGAKYWITPARREFLVGLNMMLGVQADSQLLRQVEQGLRGELSSDRYGLPFAGDNNFLFDRIDILDQPPETNWYVQIQHHDSPMRGSYRLTVGIDRADNSKTTSDLYAPVETPTVEPPSNAWTWTPRKPLANHQSGQLSQ
jgi:CRISPR-associated protein Cas5t